MNTQTIPTVLKATGSADFLAALPRLTGMDAPESCFIVLFSGSRTAGAARVDLPDETDFAHPGPELRGWLTQVARVASQGDAAVIVIETTAMLAERPAMSVHGKFALVVKRSLDALGIRLRDFCVVGADSWASFGASDEPEPRSLDEIRSSPLHDPAAQLLGVDEWREQHPGRTSDASDEISVLAERMVREANTTKHTEQETKP